MRAILDTSVAIALRDGDKQVIEAAGDMLADPAISIVTRIELENGVHRNPKLSQKRRARLDELLSGLDCLAFTDREADAYRSLIEGLAFSRRKTLDRMIAAHALVMNWPLVTLNSGDFAEIRRLNLIAL